MFYDWAWLYVLVVAMFLMVIGIPMPLIFMCIIVSAYLALFRSRD